MYEWENVFHVIRPDCYTYTYGNIGTQEHSVESFQLLVLRVPASTQSFQLLVLQVLRSNQSLQFLVLQVLASTQVISAVGIPGTRGYSSHFSVWYSRYEYSVISDVGTPGTREYSVIGWDKKWSIWRPRYSFRTVFSLNFAAFTPNGQNRSF